MNCPLRNRFQRSMCPTVPDSSFSPAIHSSWISKRFSWKRGNEYMTLFTRTQLERMNCLQCSAFRNRAFLNSDGRIQTCPTRLGKNRLEHWGVDRQLFALVP